MTAINAMKNTMSPFQEYIEEVALELLNAHSVKASDDDIKLCLSSLDSLERFVQSCPSNIKLDRIKTLLHHDRNLFDDLIKPALLKKLES
jgi:hypothetical protein